MLSSFALWCCAPTCLNEATTKHYFTNFLSTYAHSLSTICADLETWSNHFEQPDFDTLATECGWLPLHPTAISPTHTSTTSIPIHLVSNSSNEFQTLCKFRNCS